MKGNIKYIILNIITGLLTGMFVFASGYLAYNLFLLSGIENFIRYTIIGGIALVCIVFVYYYFRSVKKRKLIRYIIIILFTIIAVLGELYISNIINRGIKVIDNISKDEKTYSTAIVIKKENQKVFTKDNIGDAVFGIISNTDDVEGYTLAQDLIKKYKIDKNSLVKYDEYVTMIDDLYSGNIDAIFISGNYIDIYSKMEEYVNIEEELYTFDTISKKMKKVDTEDTINNPSKSVTEPFTILLLGVDSTNPDISKASGLGDSIMLVTFNPDTLNATVFSIPRDTYVPISCFGGYKNKITHAAAGGDSCMINTVQNFTGIQIDYYMKVNFAGLINLVDVIGGIDVDVPYSFCETDENRALANAIYVEKGMQHLNGKQALALSRNRKTYPTCGKEWNQGRRDDFVRGQNQQLVMKAIIQKAKDIKSIDELYKILDTVSISMDTNLSREQILDFYQVFKKIVLSTDSLTDANDVITIQRSYLNGSSAHIYDKRSGMTLYNFVPSSSSLKEITNAMKVNLGQKEEDYVYEFSFSADEEYEPYIIGSDAYGGSKVSTFPSLVGKSKSYVQSWCSTNGKNCSFATKDVESGSQDEVLTQSVSSGTNMDEVSSVTFTVANVVEKKKEETKPNNSGSSSSSSSSSNSESSSSGSGDNGSGSSSGNNSGTTDNTNTGGESNTSNTGDSNSESTGNEGDNGSTDTGDSTGGNE